MKKNHQTVPFVATLRKKRSAEQCQTSAPGAALLMLISKYDDLIDEC